MLLPVRQWCASAERAALSILQQTEPNLELLVIGNDDDKGWVGCGLSDSRMRWKLRQSPGIVGALNTGLLFARGEYIARMDADDWAYPERLSCQLDYLCRNPEVQLCGARVRFKSENGTSVSGGYAQYQRWLNDLTEPEAMALHCFVESPMPHPTWCAHRTVWQTIGPYRQFDGPEDYDRILNAHALGIRMGKPEPVLHDWTLHEQRLTVTDKRYRQAAFVKLKADALVRRDWPFAKRLKLPDHRSIWIAGTGETAMMWQQSLKENGISVEGFVDVNVASPAQLHRGLPVASYAQLFAIKEKVVLITAVAHPKARQRFVKEFSANGLIHGVDYILGA